MEDAVSPGVDEAPIAKKKVTKSKKVLELDAEGDGPEDAEEEGERKQKQPFEIAKVR